jgi:hypothetical protein
MFIALVAKSLRQHPILNSTLEGDRIIVHDDVGTSAWPWR